MIHVRGCIHAVNLWMSDNIGITVALCCAIGLPQVIENSKHQLTWVWSPVSTEVLSKLPHFLIKFLKDIPPSCVLPDKIFLLCQEKTVRIISMVSTSDIYEMCFICSVFHRSHSSFCESELVSFALHCPKLFPWIILDLPAPSEGTNYNNYFLQTQLHQHLFFQALLNPNKLQLIQGERQSVQWRKSVLFLS